ncbi:MAG: cation:proton antiporter [Acidobacteria bacterium]|nr:cation:proton antiporter [Acidobacteriota bacterium]
MHGAHDFLQALTVVLCVAALTTILFQRLHQPVVLGYLLAGIIVGPHVPIPLVADANIVQTLSELGVILLMFSLGLEFSFTKLVKVGASAGLTAVIQSSIVLWLGFITGRLLGWTTLESLFAGSAIAISSTTIIAKAFDEQKVGGRLRELVVGVLLVEDLIAIVLMAALTPIAGGTGLSAGVLAATAGRLFVFLFALIGIGLLVVPRATRAVNRLGSNETTLVASIGFCFATAWLASQFGYSVALGAFIAGSLVGESGEEKRVEHLVNPVRDMFAAIFFVSVGMLLDPRLVMEHWKAVAIFTAIVIVGKIIGVTLGAFLAGNGVQTSIRSGMALAQIGEFSFIIASLGLALHATRPFLYPIAVAVSAITTLTTPFLIRMSDGVASAVDRRLPRPLQTYAALYGSWWERSRKHDSGAPTRRLFLLLAADIALLCILIIGTSVYLIDLGTLIEKRVGASVIVARAAVLVAAAVLAVPLWIGIMRVVRRLSTLLAERAFPPAPPGAVDLGNAPRAAMVATVKILVLVLVGMPIVAVTQPFLPGYPAAIALSLLLLLLAITFWRSTTSLQGHVHAGAQALIGALARTTSATSTPAVDELIAGFGAPRTAIVAEGSAVIGRQLREINLRGRTGAMVLAIQRGEERILVPSAAEVLRAGDVVAIGGSEESVAAAEAVLSRP